MGTGPSKEEEDLLERSKRRSKDQSREEDHEDREASEQAEDEQRAPKRQTPMRSYRDSVLGYGKRWNIRGEEIDEGYVSDDDLIEECADGTWVGWGMSREEKIEARRPWRNSLIVKLVRRPIGYHYLWRRLRAMWRTQDDPLLIDLGNDFFVVKLLNREEYERALSEGPWMIDDHYLHVQRWRPNFIADSAKITSLPVWVRFPWLPLEYYTKEWLRYAGDTLGKTIKVDETTLAAARGRFARVCIEIDLNKPLVANYRLRGIEGQVQYEGLQDLCFTCGKYGHKEVKCPLSILESEATRVENGESKEKVPASDQGRSEDQRTGYGPWMVAQRNRRRPARNHRGNKGNGAKHEEKSAGRDHGVL